MKSIKLSAEGDLILENGDLLLVENAEELAQAVRVELATYRGEWFLDAAMGVDYYGRALLKNPNMEAVRAELLAAILRVPGIRRVDSMRFSLDGDTRKLTVDFKATAQDLTTTIEGSEVFNLA